MPRDLSKPCPTRYEHPHWQGKHNIVGIYDNGRPVGRRCVSCGAQERTDTERIFCSLECNREYHTVAVAYPGDGHETHCQNCGAPLTEPARVP